MRVIVLLIIEVVRFQLARCQLGGGAGGPSSFGYDASSACSKPYSRTGRSRFEHLPCDFQRQTWCTVAGSAYPWQAVRRFVQENQGLMRRMYGDEKHVNVLRAELEKNNVDVEFDDDRHHRYSDDLRHFQYENEDEYKYDDSNDDDDDLEESMKKPDRSKEDYEGRGFTSKILNEANLGWFSSFPKLGEYTRPHYHPTGSPTAETKATVTPTTPATTTTTTTTTVAEKLSTRLSLTEVTENTTTDTKPDANDDASTTPLITLAQIIKVQNLSINEISGQLDRVDVDVNVEILTESSAISESTADIETTEEADLTTGRSPTTIIVDESTITDESASERNNAKEELSAVVGQEFVGADNEQQFFRPRPEYRPSSTNVKPLEGSSTEGQQELYQDVAAKEQQEPVIQLRGVNACPVKEEVVAPFWANNTRGEVLALLNLYPFEQYVHWEKCTHENKQMYCRDGCRCEQQFRLHRLLAYDPSNECRGIFSDWFKFPSCCVCRCYDLPVELRVTSRSPRTHRLKRFK